MRDSQPDKATALFTAAQRLDDVSRRIFLAKACGGDDGLRRQVETLLHSHAATVAASERPSSSAVDSSPSNIPERIGRFKIVATIGEGGMGIVYEAEQDNPRRTVALKVIRAGVASGTLLKRFALESQALGRLQHPGIARIFEAGTADTPGGELPFFAMEYVQGLELREYVQRHRLSTHARLELLAAICDAVEHAHQRGIIHRDLKPGNILVDDTGQPRILDFGVARVTNSDTQATTMQTDVGQILGTLQYMSPEQVAADPDMLDTRSDVYALGVITYELLTGQLPYDLKHRMIHEAARIIREEEPTSASSMNRVFRGDIETIVATALAKDPDRRYQSSAGLARDIRRYLEDQPILARPPSAIYQLRKFAKRNKGLVVTLALLLIVLAVSIGFSTTQYFIADTRFDEIVRLADIKRLAAARSAADDLWPAHPENIHALEVWINDQAAPLRDRLPTHRETLSALRARAAPYDAEQQRRDRTTHPRATELAEHRLELAKLREPLDATEAAGAVDVAAHLEAVAQLEERIRELEHIVGTRRTWQLPSSELQWQHDTLAGLVADLETFGDQDPSHGTLANAAQRLAFARRVETDSITGPAAQQAWATAIADIRTLDAYRGLQLSPQLGLLPLRRDPHSGFWEFWHLQTGARPQPNPDPHATNPWLITGDTGLILVLLPGGTFQMGAQKDDPEQGHYDPEATAIEGPVHDITLDPFFLSKYEMTQGQWRRFTGATPSHYTVGGTSPDRVRPDGTIHEDASRHPVEQVSWIDSTATLGRLMLVLPTEAQWEYAARGGTTTPWWTGADESSIGTGRGGNLADAWARNNGAPEAWRFEDWEDHWVLHSPVGDFAPNPFGLHDTLGNVWEWTSDWTGSYKDDEVAPGSGARQVFPGYFRAYRGGSFREDATLARSSQRYENPPANRLDNLGVRPARLVVPAP